MTITEALAELKTLKARIEKKRAGVLPYLLRPAVMRDPMEKDGGVAQWISRERQGIADMETRYVALRTAIQRKNLESKLKVGDAEKTVADWLTWRREVSQGQVQFLAAIGREIANARKDPRTQGRAIKPEGEATSMDIIAHVNEVELLAESDALVGILGELDGKLSLANATLVIEV